MLGEEGGRVGVVEQQQVHIRGVVQLARAELAHAERDQPRPARDLPRLALGAGEADAPPPVRLQQKVREGEVERLLGEARQRAGDRVKRPQPGQIRRRDDQRAAPLGPPQQARDRRARRGRVRAGQQGEDALHRLLRPAVERPGQRRRLAPGELGEEGRGAQPRQRLARLGPRRELALRRVALGEPGEQSGRGLAALRPTPRNRPRGRHMHRARKGQG